ncbi:MAG: ATP-dependent sacrificial sulfur transferase LarE [Gemmatimonadota bacterium]|nr:MAG: ATP-dependent sacrificial sulfur transferase LarE [Gemmatimonadota bacterium]
MPVPSPLERILSEYPSVLVGYSGGVDSSLVAVVARQVLGRERSLAAIGVSASLPQEQHDQARDIARQFDLELVEVPTDELSNPQYIANEEDRCYHCKRELWQRMRTVANEHGIEVVVDGTNADDLLEHRPGMGAAREFVIRSPLAEAGYTKSDVRAEAREIGIPIWDAPAAPCLSSRVLYGLEVTSERLNQVEHGEAFLRELGVAGDLRVRHRGAEARIEVSPSEFATLREARDAIAAWFTGLGFSRVTLDLSGYRRGSLLVAGDPELELLVDES